MHLSAIFGSCAQLLAAPVRSGVLLGSINFKAPDGQYVWYSLEVRASEAPEIGTIDVEAEVRAWLCTVFCECVGERAGRCGLVDGCM